MQDMQQNKELTIASNRSLAEQNLSLQPELDHQKIQLTKRYCCLQDLHESYQLRRSTLGQIWTYLTHTLKPVFKWGINRSSGVWVVP